MASQSPSRTSSASEAWKPSWVCITSTGTWLFHAHQELYPRCRSRSYTGKLATQTSFLRPQAAHIHKSCLVLAASERKRADCPCKGLFVVLPCNCSLASQVIGATSETTMPFRDPAELELEICPTAIPKGGGFSGPTHSWAAVTEPVILPMTLRTAPSFTAVVCALPDSRTTAMKGRTS